MEKASLFQESGTPKYVSTASSVPKRSSNASSDVRRERENQTILDQTNLLFKKDEVTSLEDVAAKLDKSCLPSGVTLLPRGDDPFLQFVYLSTDEG